MALVSLASTTAFAHGAGPEIPRSAAALTCAGRAATVVGTPGEDLLVGSKYADVIVARGGDDIVRGRGGSDVICGGAGADWLAGGSGSDLIYGGRNDDALFGSAGRDQLQGGLGSDACFTGSGGRSKKACEPVASRNHAPNARKDVASVDEGGSVTVPVLINDTDLDRDRLSVRAVAPGAAADGVSIVDGGRSVSYSPNGHFEALGAGQSTIDSFSYVVRDGHGGTDRAVVSITVTGSDDLPVAADDSKFLDEDDPATEIGVLANDSDADGEPITIESTAGASHGQVVVTGSGSGLTYAPDTDYCGPDTFTYALNGGSVATVSVAVGCSDDPDDISVETTPALYPQFERGITDYVTRCIGEPLEMSATAKPGASVSIDGAAAGTGSSSAEVELEAGQAFTFTSTSATVEREYHVRCLPNDFPEWNFTRYSQPRQEWYLITPSLFPPFSNYLAFFDGNGVPVWWYKSDTIPLDAKVLSDGRLAWAQFNGSYPSTGYEIHDLDGTLTRVVRTNGTYTDHHDIQEAGNGNFILPAYVPREHVDLSAFGGSSDTTVLDSEIQEIDPDGNAVWAWSTKDHIGLGETGRWFASDGAFDIAHLNSIEVDGDSVIASFRHLDAVYKISRTTGEIEWKLGGTPTPESLTVLGDPHGDQPLGGQHDARILSDGTVTVHDNGTGLDRPPRAVRYRIDEEAGTATLLESVTDPDVPESVCCGSARRSADGSWLMSWGGTPKVTEFDANGARTFLLDFGTLSSYRAFPVAAGRLGRQSLRDAMETMNPR